MKLSLPTAEIFVPDGIPVDAAVARATHVGISAHQDDLEIMAYHGVLETFGRGDSHFLGVVVTNGAGSPRTGLYADYTDQMMQQIRRVEQRKAAFVGEYAAQALLDYPSSAVKDSNNANVLADLKALLGGAQPRIVYTHNLADKHDTHVAVALRVIRALRELPPEQRPERVYGCEVWRGLDWLCDEDKAVLDVAAHENLAASLLGVFDSQIAGGKRYDLATMGRRRANATYFASHGTDESEGLTFAMDLTPLVTDASLDPGAYVASYVERFARDVASRIKQFS
jgi:LmbE family N-acetylglucosaminyl deacetylase